MMKKLYLITALLHIFLIYAQGPGRKNIEPPTPKVKFTDDVAKQDIRLYIMGGIVPAITKADRKFEEKYKVRFHDFGCTPPPLEYYKEYNMLAFDYLKKKYGAEWQKEIRPNIPGYDLWIKK